MKRLIIGGLMALATTALIGAPAAQASGGETDFIHWMDSHGEQVTGSTDIVTSSVGLGYATCGLLKLTTFDDTVNTVGGNDYTYQRAALWVVGSASFLCPEYSYKLP